MKLWAVVYIQVNNQRFDIKQIIDVIETDVFSMDQVFREHVSPYVYEPPYRQVLWFLREPPLPWEGK